MAASNTLHANTQNPARPGTLRMPQISASKYSARLAAKQTQERPSSTSSSSSKSNSSSRAEFDGDSETNESSSDESAHSEYSPSSDDDEESSADERQKSVRKHSKAKRAAKKHPKLAAASPPAIPTSSSSNQPPHPSSITSPNPPLPSPSATPQPKHSPSSSSSSSNSTSPSSRVYKVYRPNPLAIANEIRTLHANALHAYQYAHQHEKNRAVLWKGGSLVVPGERSASGRVQRSDRGQRGEPLGCTIGYGSPIVVAEGAGEGGWAWGDGDEEVGEVEVEVEGSESGYEADESVVSGSEDSLSLIPSTSEASKSENGSEDQTVLGRVSQRCVVA